MPDFKAIDSIYLFLGFIVPGLIIVFVRAQFTTGRIPPPKDAVITYFVISSIYYAFVLPAVGATIAMRVGYIRAFYWIALVLIGPALAGIALGLNARHGFSRRWLAKFHLPLVHGIPTAWDWKFSDDSHQWVLVTLTNGTRFAGLFGARSFASSDQAERDVYIEKVYDLGDDDIWSDAGERGVLIASGAIQTISFWPYKGANADDHKAAQQTSQRPGWFSTGDGGVSAEKPNGERRLQSETQGGATSNNESRADGTPPQSGEWRETSEIASQG